MRYDVVLKGGRVIDPSQGVNEHMDLAVKDKKIVDLAQGIPESEAKQVIQLTSDTLVVPGLIDFHTHVYWGGAALSVNPDELLYDSGVTTCVDAGTAGAGNFLGFHEYVVKTSKCRILAFLNISYAGIFGLSEEMHVGELADIRLGSVSAAVRTGEQFSEIVGVKVRASMDGCEYPGTAPVYLAREAAEELGKPMMVHIGGSPPTVREIVPILRRGDILTHAFRGNPNSIIGRDGGVISEIIEARERGVLIDIGHGCGSFSFIVARRALEQGFTPDIISSDVHALSVNGPAYNLLVTMSKMLLLGMDIEEIIRSVTYNPARAIGYNDELGTLKEGTTADITVLKLVEGEFEFQDAFGNRMVGRQRFVPVLTILKGEVIEYEQGRSQACGA